jgi:hypothetical protein
MTWDDLRNLNKEEILARLGLQTKSDPLAWLLPALGLFGAGILVGTGLGMMMAPKPGRELRADLANRLENVLGSDTKVHMGDQRSVAVLSSPSSQG